MASIANTFFEVKNSNLINDAMQNIAGTFEASSQPDICAAGFLCVKTELIPCSGYTGINNGNQWVFNAATSGAPGTNGVKPEIYAFNSYDINTVTGINGNTWRLGAETAGLELPAGEIGTFTKIIEGEIYRFGKGNFSTTPTSLPDYKYVTIANGLLVASNSEPTEGTGFFFEILNASAAENYTVGTWNGGECYRVIAKYAPNVGS